MLVPLSEVLETTVDLILTGGEKVLDYRGKIKDCRGVADVANFVYLNKAEFHKFADRIFKFLRII